MLNLGKALRKRKRIASEERITSSEHPRKALKKRRWYIISHDCMFKKVWDWVILAFVVFTAIQVPYDSSFGPSNAMNVIEMLQQQQVDALLIVELIIDCMFILDIFINFVTTYFISSRDEVIDEPRLIAVHYLKTWFPIDLVAGFPIDWMVHNEGATVLVGCLKSIRLLRLFRLIRESGRLSKYGIAVLLLLLSFFTLIAHWFACIWHGIAIHEKDNPLSWVVLLQNSRPLVLGSNESSPTLPTREKYTSALYFVMTTMTSVGYGNISANTVAEQTFCVLLMLMGALMYSCIFGSMVTIVQGLYAKSSNFLNRIRQVQEFLKSYKIPEELQKSVIDYVHREWIASRGVDLCSVLQQFPDCIQADITYELYRHVFSGVKIFDRATVSCMRALAMKFRTINLQANSFFLRQGDEIDCLYILGKGTLEVLVNGDVLSVMSATSLFGYDFKSTSEYPKSTANVLASNAVEIHFIRKEAMLHILKAYPKFAASFYASYKPTYNLCDEAEEGYYPTIAKHEKSHVLAVAKKATGVTALNKWTMRIHPKPLQSNTNAENPTSDGPIPKMANGHDTGSQKFHFLRDSGVCMDSSGTTTSPRGPSAVSQARTSSLNVFPQSVDNEQLLLRLNSLEKSFQQLQKDLNEKFHIVIKTLGEKNTSKGV